MKYQVVAYMRIDPEEPQVFDTIEEAEKEQAQLELPIDTNIYVVEEVEEK